MKDVITIKGARTHNLKNISVTLPRNQLVVITGLSGSGKSSLAFDTIYAEGQRRYVESLSVYARQFLDRMEKPDVDLIEGLSPAVSVEQKAASHNPRSTVGTSTEIYDYLRLLFARIGKPYCYSCGRLIEKQTISEIVQRCSSEDETKRINILAPFIENKKGEHLRELARLREKGFVRARIDGIMYDLGEPINLDPKKKHNVDVVVDRLIITAQTKTRLYESLETAFTLGCGLAKIEYLDDSRRVVRTELMSTNNVCVHCHVSYPRIEPQMFSFNSPQGACGHCTGLGELMYVDENLVVPDEKISINQGAIVPWFGKKTNYYQALLEALAKKYRFDLNAPYGGLSAKVKAIIFNGSPDPIKVNTGRQTYEAFFEGVKNNMMRRYKETDSDWMRAELVKYMNYQPCPSCGGARLKNESLNIRIHNHNITQLTTLSIDRLEGFLKKLTLEKADKEIASSIIKEILSRLNFLMNVGLSYLTLDRKSHTLSGGEAQRIRLASQIGSALVGVTYVLDEPSVGLHQRDNHKLIESLKKLKDLGNTVIVVEHDEETIRASDFIIDMGPGAGIHGGKVVFSGTIDEMSSANESITAQYMTHKKTLSPPPFRRPATERRITLCGACENNLKNIDVSIPLGCFVCVTGVSGSGKSSLINETLIPALKKKLYKSKIKAGKHKAITGFDLIDKVVDIDQAPIGRTPRSNPATYTGLLAPIRELFSELHEAKARGYSPGRFSFNVKGGRCERCEGDGHIRIEMHFMPDVFVKCEECGGARYNEETLNIRFKGKNIAEILDMTIEEAMIFFQNIPQVCKRAKTLFDVGLGYIKLGQSATTLSGGEAQRIKLSRELSKRATGKTLYILDEPTTGLHFEDVKQLLDVLQKIVCSGNTVLVIEHNLHVIKFADYLIDLGPDGGDAGGYLLAQGTPEEILKCEQSSTAKYLSQII